MIRPIFTRFFEKRPVEDETFRRMLIALLAFLLVANLTFIPAGIATTLPLQIIIAVLSILLGGSIFLAYRGNLTAGRYLIPLGITVALTYVAVTGYGFRSSAAIVGLISATVLASITLGEWGAVGFGLITTIITLGLGIGEYSGAFLPATPTGLVAPEDILSAGILLVTNFGILFIAVRRLNNIAARARENETASLSANRELIELKNSLETRVMDRTAELEAANQNTARRASQFQSIVQVSRAISSLQNLNMLLPRITELVSENFGYYHVAIFLVDNNQEYAILSAANSEGGKRMLERGHMLKVGETGIVGYVTGYAVPRIALDTGTDPVFFNNPDLPNTRSEMALPLKIGTRTIGALDVQSTEQSAFSEEDMGTLSILADQVSLAIENTRLLEATQRALTEAQTLYQQYSKGEWQRLARAERTAGYRYTAEGVMPLETPLDSESIRKAAETGETYLYENLQKGEPPQVAIPIKLRGEVVGIINIRLPGHHVWSDDDVDIVEALADRLALSIENARLFQSTTDRAERERVVSEIAAKISGSVRMESILRTAAQELSTALNGSEVLIQLQTGKQIGDPG